MRSCAWVLLALLATGCEDQRRVQENHRRNMAALQQFEKAQHDSDPRNWPFDRLLAALASTDHNARSEAAVELMVRKDAKASPALRRCLGTEEHGVVAARCARALLAIGLPEDFEAVQTHVAGNIATIDSELIGALGQVDADWAAVHLEAVQAQATDNTRRRQAIGALEARRRRLGP